MVVLDTVTKRSSCIRPGAASKVSRGASGLLTATQTITDSARTAVSAATRLHAQAQRMRASLLRLDSESYVTSAGCREAASMVYTTARLAGEAAAAVGDTGVAVGEVQEMARNFVEVLDAAGAWQEEPAPKPEPPPPSKDKEEEDADSSDEDSAPMTTQSRQMLLRKINAEVLGLQQELRSLVAKSPALIEVVSVGQKQNLFSLVAELMEKARTEVSKNPNAFVQSKEGSAEAFVTAVLSAVQFIVAAGKWSKIAVPSLEARLVRLAALLDATKVHEMVVELFDHAMACAENPAKVLLREHLTAAANSIRVFA
mmetsp:Transcript_30108/g.63817  ORF Transcript_30108/g.63817 Transcript_30108/m.63817 type:complete len:313 (+) Transcript_30108:2-940(+)